MKPFNVVFANTIFILRDSIERASFYIMWEATYFVSPKEEGEHIGEAVKVAMEAYDEISNLYALESARRPRYTVYYGDLW